MHAYFLQFQFCYYFPYILFLVSLIFYSSILFAKFCINCYYFFHFFHSILYCFSNFLYILTPIMPRFFIPRFLWLLYPVTYGCSILPFVAALSCRLQYRLFHLSTHFSYYSHSVFTHSILFGNFHLFSHCNLHFNTFISFCILITLFHFRVLYLSVPFFFGTLLHQWGFYIKSPVFNFNSLICLSPSFHLSHLRETPFVI